MSPTVSDLLKVNARVVWDCDVGKALGHIGAHGGEVDLEAVRKARGDGFTFANRRPRCTVPGCPGRVRFKDATSAYWKPLDTITDRDPAHWEWSERRDSELTSLGWSMVDGYWKPPAGNPLAR